MEYQFNIKITIPTTWVDVKKGNVWRKIYRVIIIFIDINESIIYIPCIVCRAKKVGVESNFVV